MKYFQVNKLVHFHLIKWSQLKKLVHFQLVKYFQFAHKLNAHRANFLNELNYVHLPIHQMVLIRGGVTVYCQLCFTFGSSALPSTDGRFRCFTLRDIR